LCIGLFSCKHPVCRVLTTSKSPSLVRKIVAEAKAAGELSHRIFLVKEEIKALHIQSQDDSDFLKTRHRSKSSREEDALQALRDHRKYLVRMGYLQQKELDQLEMLSQEIEASLKEKTNDLLERINPSQSG
jgi:hypothetical protein